MTQNSDAEVLAEVRGHLGVLTLNRPKAANALNLAMTETLLEQLKAWRHDDAVTQVVIRGAGDRGLCAGGDIVGIYRELTSVSEQGLDISSADLKTEQFWRAEYELNVLIDEYPKPYVAFMDGLTLGGGIGVSAHGSHRVVTERTKAGMPETSIGFVPDVGGTYLLSRAPGALGVYAALTGAHLGAAEVLQLGLADTFVASEQLEDLAQALEHSSADDVLARFAGQSEASRIGSTTTSENWINEVFAHHDVEQIVAELESRGASGPPEIHETLQVLQTKSPSSLKLTRELLVRADGADLRSCLQQEFWVARRRCSAADFVEGIRAQVIDKDRQPHWQPATLAQVSDTEVQAQFEPADRYLLSF